jgi:malonate transporter
MPIVSRAFLDTLVPVFFVLGLGYYAGFRGRINNRDTSALNVALMHFALPCSLFLAVAKTSLWSLKSQSHLIVAITVAMAFTYASIFVLSGTIFRASVAEAAVNSLTVAFANNVATATQHIWLGWRDCCGSEHCCRSAGNLARHAGPSGVLQ